MEVKEYVDETGKSPFSIWFNHLEAIAAGKVSTALYRMEQGNFSNAKGVGEGVLEYKIDFGPGYRLYFGKEGANMVIILGGGTKKGQQKDISTAKAY
ncbi:MAG: type II toxin-antitoxin system RelE/ParE family toxin [Thermodesulfobacteriota bacterium]|nr:type II toxin-antitoxin system RelE/ParE family toxin [Thermodesulfobacteriota bacterium]